MTQKMIEFLLKYANPSIVYRIKCEILQNISKEDGLSKEAALNVYHGIFKTECGKKICKEMFGIC